MLAASTRRNALASSRRRGCLAPQACAASQASCSRCVCGAQRRALSASAPLLLSALLFVPLMVRQLCRQVCACVSRLFSRSASPGWAQAPASAQPLRGDARARCAREKETAPTRATRQPLALRTRCVPSASCRAHAAVAASPGGLRAQRRAPPVPPPLSRLPPATGAAPRPGKRCAREKPASAAVSAAGERAHSRCPNISAPSQPLTPRPLR